MKCGFVIFDGKIEDYFEFAGKAGATHLEVDLFAREQKIEMMDSHRVARINRLAEEYGISLSLHLPYCLNPADLVPEISRAYVEYFKKAFGLAQQLQVKWITAHPGYYQGLSSWDWMRQEAMSRLQVFLEDMLAMCEKTGIPLALENTTKLPEDGQFFNLGCCVEDFQTLFDGIDSSYLRMCLDTGHANTAGGVMPYLAQLWSRIINIHVHDNLGVMDNHMPPGRGTIEWDPIWRHLTGHGYSGWLNVELLEDADKIEAFKFMRQGCKQTDLERGVAL